MFTKHVTHVHSWARSFWPGVLAVIGAALAASACSSSDASTTSHGSIFPPGATNEDAGGTSGSDGGPMGPKATYRIAHLSPDLPAIDFCYRNTTSDAWVGPVLNANASPGAPSADSGAASDGAPPAADAASPDAASADAASADAASHAGDASAVGDASAAADSSAFVDANGGVDANGAPDAAWSDAEAIDAAANDAAPDAGEVDSGGAGFFDAGASDGSSPSALGYLSVTDYASIKGSGTFDIGLVAAGSTGCGEPLAVAQVTLDAGKRATIAIVGRAMVDAGASDALAILAFTDDPTVAEKAARVRFVNAALGNASRPEAGALAASVIGGGTTSLLAADVEPSHASTPTGISPVIDALGYNDATPQTATAALSIDAITSSWPSPWVSPITDLALRAGSIHTGFIVSGNSSILKVVWCNDTDVATAPVVRCTVLDPSP